MLRYYRNDYLVMLNVKVKVWKTDIAPFNEGTSPQKCSGTACIVEGSYHSTHSSCEAKFKPAYQRDSLLGCKVSTADHSIYRCYYYYQSTYEIHEKINYAFDKKMRTFIQKQSSGTKWYDHTQRQCKTKDTYIRISIIPVLGNVVNKADVSRVLIN